MAYRSKVSSRGSRRMFKRSSARTLKVNVLPSISRGGIRL